MDKIDELIKNLEACINAKFVRSAFITTVDGFSEVDAARAALRAEFDAQAARVAELEALVEKGNYAIGENCNLRIELLEKTEELAALKEERRWIPVGEPPKCTKIINCYSADNLEYGVYPVYFCVEYKMPFLDDDGKPVFPEPTHWQELPQPPE